MIDNKSNIAGGKQADIESGLAEKIKSGDPAAFEKLFRTYCQNLVNFSRRYIRDKQIAENIVQDVFLKIWQNRHTIDSSQSIKSYLFAAVKNESFKHLRHLDVETRSYDKIVKLVNVEKTPDEVLDEKELQEKVNSALNDLPEKCREIFFMSRFDKLKYAEIAEILDISIKTVETQIGRALKKLRENLSAAIMILLFILTWFL
ncbi:RNA polymerase sigma-70 factor [Bacteroidota bacterium]